MKTYQVKGGGVVTQKRRRSVVGEGLAPSRRLGGEEDGFYQSVVRVGAVFQMSDLTADGYIDIYIVENGIGEYVLVYIRNWPS